MFGTIRFHMETACFELGNNGSGSKDILSYNSGAHLWNQAKSLDDSLSFWYHLISFFAKLRHSCFNESSLLVWVARLKPWKEHKWVCLGFVRITKLMHPDPEKYYDCVTKPKPSSCTECRESMILRSLIVIGPKGAIIFYEVGGGVCLWGEHNFCG